MIELVGSPRNHLLWVVRHGESTWNALGRMQREIAHPPLTARGTTQAYTAGYTLRDKTIDRIACSDAVSAILDMLHACDATTRQGRTGTDVPNGSVVGINLRRLSRFVDLP